MTRAGGVSRRLALLRPCIVPATPPLGGGTREGGVRVPCSIPLPVRCGARCARARGAGIRRREDHGQAVRPPRRRAGRDDSRVLDQQPAAERAGRCRQPDAAEQDDGRRERLLPGADERRRLGGLLLQRRRRGELDEQPAARVPAGRDCRGPGLAAARSRRLRGRSGAGLGSVRQRLLRRDRFQPDASRRTGRSGWPATAGWRAACRTTRERRLSRVGRRARSSSGISTTR